MSQNITLIYCTIRKILQFSTPSFFFFFFFETPGTWKKRKSKITLGSDLASVSCAWLCLLQNDSYASSCKLSLIGELLTRWVILMIHNSKHCSRFAWDRQCFFKQVHHGNKEDLGESAHNTNIIPIVQLPLLMVYMRIQNTWENLPTIQIWYRLFNCHCYNETDKSNNFMYSAHYVEPIKFWQNKHILASLLWHFVFVYELAIKLIQLIRKETFLAHTPHSQSLHVPFKGFLVCLFCHKTFLWITDFKKLIQWQ